MKPRLQKEVDQSLWTLHERPVRCFHDLSEIFVLEF